MFFSPIESMVIFPSLATWVVSSEAQKHKELSSFSKALLWNSQALKRETKSAKNVSGQILATSHVFENPKR